MFSVMFMSKVARFKRNMAAAKAQTFEAAVSCESMCRDQHPAFTIVPDLIEITIVPRAYRKRMKNIQQPDGKCLIFSTSSKQLSNHVSPKLRLFGRTISYSV
jgi:hypothetical protein